MDNKTDDYNDDWAVPADTRIRGHINDSTSISR